jgi:hypothetical protein
VPERLDDHALEHLRYIRETMERAGAFTAVPGWGSMLIGASALGATPLAGIPTESTRWLEIWIAEAAIAAAIGMAAIAWKTRQSGSPLVAGPARRFALVYLPPLAAGVVLTGFFTASGLIRRLPGCWLLLYGTALASGGALSVPVVPVMGISFMALGAAAFAMPASWGHLFMAAGFGGFHMGFGWVIARRYGG